MKRLVLLGGTAVTALALAGVAVADSPYEMVEGGYGIGAATANVIAHDGPNGPHGHGAVMLQGQGRVFEGEVTCVRVDGNRAAVGMRFDDDGDGNFTHVISYYEDNGPPPGAGTAAPDRVGNRPTSPTPVACLDPDNFFNVFGVPIQQGNLVVRDAPNAP